MEDDIDNTMAGEKSQQISMLGEIVLRQQGTIPTDSLSSPSTVKSIRKLIWM